MTYRVLIVEDDEELQEFYSLMLEGMECQIIRAHDGLEALARLNEASPNLILLDILLDEMMGDEFFATMRNDPRWKQIPVVVATVLPKERCSSVLGQDSRTRYLRKPFGRDALLAAVRTGLAQSTMSG